MSTKISIENANNGDFRYSILNAYFFDMKDLQNDLLKMKKENILKKDEIQKAINTAKNKIEKIFEKEERDPFRFISFDYDRIVTKQTEKSLDKADEEYNEMIKNLKETLRQVDGMLELADTYEQRLEILQKYDIVNEEGNYIL